jgi:hypothetical protein
MRIADEGAIAGDAARDIERSSIPPYRFLLCTSGLEMIALRRLAALISAGPNLPMAARLGQQRPVSCSAGRSAGPNGPDGWHRSFGPGGAIVEALLASKIGRQFLLARGHLFVKIIFTLS